MTAAVREHVCTSTCARRCAELEEERQALRAVLHRSEQAHASPGPTTETADLHERNVRIHGAARADLARWLALVRCVVYLRECEHRRKERAMLEALEALERAKAAEAGEARWLRVGVWLARRVDECRARLGKHSKLVTRIDFSPAPSMATETDYIDPTDIESNTEDEDIKW